MPVIRTPEERFRNLPGYNFNEKYVEVGNRNLRIHCVDEGSGETVLCLHGEPSWSYLYRKMIPILSRKHRVVAPDLIGFGKSDKFTEKSDYTFEMHRDTVRGFVEKLDLNGITLVCQDWGGLIGLRVVSMIPERFSRLVIMNTGLPTGEQHLPSGFIMWRKYSQLLPVLPIGLVMKMGTMPAKAGQKPSLKNFRKHSASIPKDVIRAYQAPFPSNKFKAGAMVFPLLVPDRPDHPVADEMRKAQEGMKKWNKPALIMFSDGDPVTRGSDQMFLELIPTAKNYPSITIEDAGHFLQENKGEEIAGHILDFMERT